jgi:argininosuccinate synthase
VAVDERPLEAEELVVELNQRGGAHGVGRIDMVEDRLVGIKSREVYEAPAATILHTAHRALEALTIGRSLRQLKDHLARVFAQLVYDGYWYSEVRAALQAFFTRSQQYVTGSVRVKLYKGQATAIGRTSPFSLYEYKLATYGSEDEFDQKASEGFCRIWSLPLAGEARRAEVSDRKGKAPTVH